MPKRSPNPPPLNTGGVATIGTAPSAEATESPVIGTASDAEIPEFCCPEEEVLLQEQVSADNANQLPRVRELSPEAKEREAKRLEDAKLRNEWYEAFKAHSEKDNELRQEWRQLISEKAEISKVLYNGEIDNLSVDEIRKIRAKHREKQRQIKAAWKRLEEWRRNAPVEPT